MNIFSLLAFLFNEILELKSSDVDINPQYSESLDMEIFTIHLMFENNPSLAPKQKLKDNEVNRLPFFPKQGLEAFQAGLDEVSPFPLTLLAFLLYVHVLNCIRFQNYIQLLQTLESARTSKLKDAKRSLSLSPCSCRIIRLQLPLT